jgi:two-component system, NarL family, nitrate/nitrite response regulator NarL
MFRVLLIHTVRVYREALASALRRESTIDEVRAVASLDATLDRPPAAPPDIVLLDVGTTNGAQGVREVLRRFPHAPVVAIGAVESLDEIVGLLESGAAGFLANEASLESLPSFIASVTCGEMPCSPQVAAALSRRLALLAAERGDATPISRLTPRELQILDLLERGLSNKEIARALHITVLTVKNHVHNLLEKLQVRRRGEAAARARALLLRSAPPGGARLD